MSKGKLHHIEIEPAANGGFSVTHHYQPTAQHVKGSMFGGVAMHAPPPSVHTFGKKEHQSLTAHLAQALGLGNAEEEAGEAGKQEE